MELRVLGPVEVWASGSPVDAGTPRQRGVLAALAVDPNRPVLMETLIDRVWGDTPSRQVRATLYAYIARLRQLLGKASAEGGEPVSLVRRSGGYELRIASDLVDLHRFHALVNQARRPGCADLERARLLTQALALWHGEPLAGLPGAWATQVRARSIQQRLDTAVEWAQVQLRVGRPQAIIGPVTDLLGEHPFAEPLAAVLIQALATLGRAPEALGHYAALRQRLADELGIDPGPGLRQLHQTILRGGFEAANEAPARVRSAPTTVAPAQLPLDAYGFTGRQAELAHLDTLLATAETQPTTVVITAIAGTAGVGKTALAVHWAHRVADRFPDGQLYVNLRGFDPSGQPLAPAAAVRGLLDALEVAPSRVPADLDAQVALYRSLLAGRRFLVVLDNAHDAAQVRPLLPGAPGCLAVITSRNRLTGLVTTEGAHPVNLPPFTTDEAQQLLTRRLGPDRVAAEPEAVDEIITRTGRLPLALTIVAGRAATDHHHRLRVLADELRTSGLAALTADDPAADLRTVFSWSYRALDPPAARLFRLLGLHPGPDLSVHAAASLLGLPYAETRGLLADLTRAHLLAEPTPGRYAPHDLLRAYAIELGGTEESEAERRAARHRLLDHYLHAAHAGSMLISPNRDAISVAPAQPGVSREQISDRRQAVAWFTAEHRVLVAAIESAASDGFDVHAWQLAWATASVFNVRGLWHDLVATHLVALKAIGRLADRFGEAHLHHGLGGAYFRLRQFDRARAHYEHAIDLFGQTGHGVSQATSLLGLGPVAHCQRRYQDGLGYLLRALALYRAEGHRAGQARALNNIGQEYANLGDHQQALTYCRQAVAMHRASGDLRGLAAALDSLGYAHHHRGDHADAIAHYQQASDLFREVGDHLNEAATLVRLGETHHAAGDPRSTRDAWQRALASYEALDRPEADEIRGRLRALPD